MTDRGKISLVTYDILTDKTGRRYFEYGCMFDRIYIDGFREENKVCLFESFGDDEKRIV